MFKDSYKRANDSLKLSDSRKEQILDDIRKAKKRRHTRILPYAAAAIAACLLLFIVLDVFSVFEGGIFHSVNKKKYDAKSYADIYEVLSPLCKASNGLVKGELAETDTVNEAAGAEPEAAGGSSDDFSQTNVQTEGVDEGDIVKTDGEYIYALSQSCIAIYKADGENTELVSKTKLSQSKKSNSIYYFEMYYYDDMLIIIADEYETESKGLFNYYYYNESVKTKLLFYDVKVKASPELINSIETDGSYTQSRLTKGVLYVVTSYSVYNDLKEDSPETYIPGYCDKNGEALISASDICIPENAESASYATVSTVDMENTGVFKSTVSILGGASDIYASGDSIVIYRNYYDYSERAIEISDDGYTVLSDNAESDIHLYENSSKAYLYLVSMNDGNVEFTAHTTIDGNIDSQFSIDEYKGYFRIVSTGETYSHAMRKVSEGGSNYEEYIDVEGLEGSKTSTTLYVLDKKLDAVGKIEDIANGEYVKSARFMGDIGYFVTFRQTDPLFSVDLSNPQEPKVLGELKIPGFSEYLQSYGENLLLGFGMAADMYTGGTYGLKLSMFNVKDPTNVKEIACHEIRDAYSAALYNHKAILADANKNIIGFPANNGYMIFSYEKGEFKLKGIIKDECDWNDLMRGLYIGEYYYVVDTESVTVSVLDLENFKLLCKK